jgi:hypothetical protein
VPVVACLHRERERGFAFAHYQCFRPSSSQSSQSTKDKEIAELKSQIHALSQKADDLESAARKKDRHGQRSRTVELEQTSPLLYQTPTGKPDKRDASPVASVDSAHDDARTGAFLDEAPTDTWFDSRLQEQLASMQLDEKGKVMFKLNCLRDVHTALASAAAEKDEIISKQAAEMRVLQERMKQLERVMVVGADRINFMEEQRDASLLLLRKVIAEGKQLEIARQRLLALILDDDVAQDHKTAMRTVLLSGNVENAVKLVRLVERSLVKHRGLSAECEVIQEDAEEEDIEGEEVPSQSTQHREEEGQMEIENETDSQEEVLLTTTTQKQVDREEEGQMEIENETDSQIELFSKTTTQQQVDASADDALRGKSESIEIKTDEGRELEMSSAVSQNFRPETRGILLELEDAVAQHVKIQDHASVSYTPATQHSQVVAENDCREVSPGNEVARLNADRRYESHDSVLTGALMLMGLTPMSTPQALKDFPKSSRMGTLQELKDTENSPQDSVQMIAEKLDVLKTKSSLQAPESVAYNRTSNGAAAIQPSQAESLPQYASHAVAASPQTVSTRDGGVQQNLQSPPKGLGNVSVNLGQDVANDTLLVGLDRSRSIAFDRLFHFVFEMVSCASEMISCTVECPVFQTHVFRLTFYRVDRKSISELARLEEEKVRLAQSIEDMKSELKKALTIDEALQTYTHHMEVLILSETSLSACLSSVLLDILSPA